MQRDLSLRDYAGILRRAGRNALDDQITDAAAALAYYAFLSLPAVLLLAVGVFGLVADESAVTTIVDRLAAVMPAEAVSLLRESLDRVVANRGSSIAVVVVGTALALWTTTSAMTALMRALNRIHRREETRGFVRQRLTALVMLLLAATACLLIFGLLVLGPHVSGWVGREVNLESVVDAVWWSAQWPILILGLLAFFAVVLVLGPDVEQRRRRFITPGSVLAVLIWLGASGLFAYYASGFASYNKTWGSLTAIVVMLTWLWLSALALLLGAEVDSEAQRARAPRRDDGTNTYARIPAKG